MSRWQCSKCGGAGVATLRTFGLVVRCPVCMRKVLVAHGQQQVLVPGFGVRAKPRPELVPGFGGRAKPRPEGDDYEF